MVKMLSRQEADDLLIGAMFFGCGGGGDPEDGRRIINEVYSRGNKFSLMDPGELADESLVAIVGYVGGGISKKEKELVKDLKKVEDPVLIAVKELAAYLDEEFVAYMPSEIGPGNTFVPLYLSALEKKPTLDADTAGRAKPSVSNSTTCIVGISATPLVIASEFGDIIILKDSLNEHRVEDVCRYMARASGGMCAVARCPARGQELKKGIVSNSISRAIDVGRAIREAKDNPVQELIKAVGGIKLFEGRIVNFSREERGGFMWGEIEFEGIKTYRGHKYKVWYKNENLITWKDEKIDVTCPDIISIVDSKTGIGIYNWGNDLKRGRECTVIGVKAADIWRTKAGIEIFGPKQFGFDIEYRPLED